MRLAFIADVHVGNHAEGARAHAPGVNSRCAEVLSALERAIMCSAEATALVSLGDLLDTSRALPQMIAATQRSFRYRNAQPVHLLMGNHERESQREGDHSLGPFAHMRGVHVIDQPCDVGGLPKPVRVAAVPFEARPAADLLSELSGRASIIACHAGVYDDETVRSSPYLVQGNDVVHVRHVLDVARLATCRLVLAGNWHSHKWYKSGDGTSVIQVGALVPTGWDNPGLHGYGSLMLVDVDNISGEVQDVRRVEIPGPRFIRLQGARQVDGFEASLGALVQNSAHIRSCGLYLRAEVEPAEVIRCRAVLDASQLKNVAYVSVLPAQDEALAGAAEAARRMPEIDLARALEDFVGTLDVAAGVDRGEVFRGAARLLGLEVCV